MSLLDNIFSSLFKIKDSFDMARSKAGTWEKAFGKGSIFDKGTKVNNPYSQVSNVYKPVKAISDSVIQAQIKIKLIDKDEDVLDKDLMALLEKPNPLMSKKDFIQAVAGFHAIYDEIMIIKSIDKSVRPGKLPTELWPVNPASMEEIVENQVIVGWKHKKTNKPFTKEEVIFSKGFNPANPYRGLSPLDPVSQEIDIAYQSLVFNKAFFDNSGTPSLALSTEGSLNEVQRERLQQWINKNYRGASKAFKTLVLEKGMKANHLSHSHKDMEFLEQMKYSREELLGVFRVPKSLFSITDDLNYATANEQKRLFWEDTLIPILQKIENSLNKSLVTPYNPRIRIAFDTSNVPALKEVWIQKIDAGLKLQTLGFTRNEINDRLGLGFDENKEWGDTYLVPFNMMPVQNAITPPKIEEVKSVKLIEPEKKDLAEQARRMAQNRFEKVHSQLEKAMAGKLKSFFYGQRKRALEEVRKGLSSWNKKDAVSFGMKWDDENEELIRKITPYVAASIKAGFDYAESFGLQALAQSQLDIAQSTLIQQLSRKIKDINHTVRNQISDAISLGLKEGETIQAISDRIKHVYNMASKRSTMIAQTEVTGAMNSGQLSYYKESGVKKKRWLVAGSDARDSHLRCAGQGPISIQADFINGLKFPGDATGGAGEVVNCRCSISPVVE